MLKQHCTSFPEIAQGKSWANIEKKDKIVPNRIITLSYLKMTSGSEDEISPLLWINSVNVLAVLIYYKLFYYFTISKMSSQSRVTSSG